MVHDVDIFYVEVPNLKTVTHRICKSWSTGPPTQPPLFFLFFVVVHFYPHGLPISMRIRAYFGAGPGTTTILGRE